MAIFKNYLERLLQANTDADASQAGVSDSWVQAYIEGFPLDISIGAPIAWDPMSASIIGEDITIDSNDHTKIHVANVGLYVLSLTMHVSVAATAGYVYLNPIVTGAGYWNNGSDSGAAAIPAGGGYATITFPPAKFDEGDVIINAVLADATLGGSTQVYLVRIS